jgi:hypothetical protein
MLIRLHSRPMPVFLRALGVIAIGILSMRSAVAQSQTSRYWDGNGTTLGAGVAPIKQHLFCKSRFSEVGHLASMFR